jgi:hypothetical protein
MKQKSHVKNHEAQWFREGRLDIRLSFAFRGGTPNANPHATPLSYMPASACFGWRRT